VTRRRRILLLCATRRGVAFLRRLAACCPDAELTVVSFPPEPWEPDYLPELRLAASEAGARLVLNRRVERENLYPNEDPDLLLAVSWRYLVPREVWGRARLGAYVFHDSLLPKYRGFSPTPWAIIHGESATGVSLIEMAEEADRGRLVAQERVEIGVDEYIGTVMERVTEAYLRVLERTLPDLLAGAARPVAQDEAAATYCGRRRPEDNVIDWAWPARRSFNLIRACAAPYPGAFFRHEGRIVTVWECDPPEEFSGAGELPAGRVVEVVRGAGARVLAGDRRTLLLRVVQREGEPARRADLVFGQGTANLA
jgi:methionyl-tRNA formyltransferase